MGDLTDHFSRKEFACKCNCGSDRISAELVSKLEIVRLMYGKPMHITSGLRCEQHNKKVKGAENSTHMDGLAADIAVNGCFERDQIVGFLRTHFSRMGIARGFIHVDVADGEGRPSPCLWVY
tara:strand:+ start:906 stop:1271 length:366 start_codon:yes stop_codon:yes gene_type:complete